MTRIQRKILTFLVLTLALSAIFYGLILTAGSTAAAGGLGVLGLMWSPGVAALLAQTLFEHSLSGLGWRLGKAKYLALAFMLPLLYGGVVYGVTWLAGLGGFPEPGLMALIEQRWGGLTGSPALQILLTLVMTVIFTLPGALISGLGEEIGWRGLFVPALARMTSFTRAVLISGAVWAVWHMPLILFSDYNLPGVPRWYAVLMFTIMVLGISFAFAWLRLKSGSLWPPTLLHAAHNLLIQGFFTPMTAQKPITPYIIDEFGVGLALAGVVVALIFWSRRQMIQAG